MHDSEDGNACSCETFRYPPRRVFNINAVSHVSQSYINKKKQNKNKNKKTNKEGELSEQNMVPTNACALEESRVIGVPAAAQNSHEDSK